MNLRTEINPRFLMRMGLVGLFCIGMTGLCIKDGLWAWPAQSERAHAYLEFKEANPEVGEKDLFEQWKEVATEKGWEPGVGGRQITPYGPPKKEDDFVLQLYMGGFTGIIGLFFLTRLLRNRGCWIEADDNGLRTSEKREVTFDQVTELDKKKWDNKGIAKLYYQQDGRKNKIVLDDCNYDRKTTNEILRHVESKIGVDKITNGKPEPPVKTEAVDEAPSPAV